MEAHEAEALVAMLNAAYPNAKLDDTSRSVYSANLQDLEADEAKQAIIDLIRSGGDFLPSVSAIFDKVVAHRLEQRGLPQWTEAWVLANDWAARLHTAVSAGDDDLLAQVRGEIAPEIREAVKVIGGSYSVLTTDNPQVLRAHFRDAYLVEAGKGERDVRVAVGQLRPPAPAVGQLVQELLQSRELGSGVTRDLP